MESEAVKLSPALHQDERLLNPAWMFSSVHYPAN